MKQEFYCLKKTKAILKDSLAFLMNVLTLFPLHHLKNNFFIAVSFIQHSYPVL
jgi:hypothetical protein